ncbi:hypothetical protein ACFLTK_06005, partial [Chloroflexota bacterium]
FRLVQPSSPKPKLLLIASLTQDNVDSLGDYVAGADAGLLTISKLSPGAKTLQQVCQSVPDIPWGGWLRDIGRGDIGQIVKVGGDFVVFPAANTSLVMLQNAEVGKILQVEASLGDGLLRAVNELPVDAVLIASEPEGEHLTCHHLMLFHHLANLFTKPLLVCIPSKVTAGELQALWEVGVDGVIVESGVGQPEERLNKLRRAIDKLTFPPRCQQGQAEALLPYLSREPDVVTEEEE